MMSSCYRNKIKAPADRQTRICLSTATKRPNRNQLTSNNNMDLNNFVTMFDIRTFITIIIFMLIRIFHFCVQHSAFGNIVWVLQKNLLRAPLNIVCRINKEQKQCIGLIWVKHDIKYFSLQVIRSLRTRVTYLRKISIKLQLLASEVKNNTKNVYFYFYRTS